MGAWTAYVRAGTAALADRWRSGPGRTAPYPVDTGLALAAAAISVWAVFCDGRGWPWWVYLLVVAAAAPLPWRRRAPFTVWLVSGVFSLTQSIVAHSVAPQIPLHQVLTVYTVADRGRDWQRWLMLAILVPANILGTRSPNGMLFSLLMSVGSFILGSLTRELRRRARVEAERARAEAERAREAALRAAGEAGRAVAEERGRIAREMHDILAHAVSLMVIQAEAGPLVVRSDPDRAIRTFDTIADSGRDAMVQLRRVLGVLKEDGARPELAPQPVLAELPAVVDRVRDAGITVRAEIEEHGPADVQAAAYRIVQEALTNVLKHAGARRVSVRVGVRGPALEVEVADDGRGVPPAHGDALPGGRGLIGIRERAAACGGSAEAGPRPGGGFLVNARLPLDI
ncbi:sensor histidine kinase [Streptomyces sp. NRRL B-24484]|uniref:sensor histidine kinase n=1 Tax=Streptomyces sp. NRRL B-24484 TaxID=1463833 RepID=UPI0004C1DF51|nr:histidine kinase [Streptomyces sp. NRRL B-24484]